MRKAILATALLLSTLASQAKTLIVYYSYTNNIERIVNELRTQIDADVLEVEPAEKGLDYAANNYAIGDAQIAAIRENPDDAESYPTIDPADIDLPQYATVIIGVPLWFSQMAAPLQSFLYQYGRQMAGKNIGLIVSSASSSIDGVETDAKRLIPQGRFLSPSLWIRSSQTSNAKALLGNWLQAIGYDNLISGIGDINAPADSRLTVYSLSGRKLLADAQSTAGLPAGLYIVNGKKTLLAR